MEKIKNGNKIKIYQTINKFVKDSVSLFAILTLSMFIFAGISADINEEEIIRNLEDKKDQIINMLKTDPEYSKIYSSVVEDQTELLNKGIISRKEYNNAINSVTNDDTVKAIAGGKYPELYSALKEIDKEIEDTDKNNLLMGALNGGAGALMFYGLGYVVDELTTSKTKEYERENE